ncbi:MAG TPA: ABC transporter ATP-binding protein [Candidatus Marinimicrobia bacterium]|nr:ABC transporter ATP-binding protein [Candidatus Neomarinimicrobiota bacterium]
MYSRILGLARPHWKLIALSLAASLIFVFFNSLSVWVTASFITNILTDFESLVNSQAHLKALDERTANETLKLWTNRLILGETPIDTLKVLCITIFIAFLMKNLFLYLKNFLTGLVQIKVITDLRNRLFDHLTTLSLSFFSKKQSGELTSILLNDVAAIRRSLAVSFHKLLVEPINILAFSILLLIINWKLTLAAALILPASTLLIVAVGKSIRRKAMRSSKQISGIVSIIQETIGSIRIVKSFTMEKGELDKFRRETKKFYHLQRRQFVLRYASVPTTEIIGVTMGVVLLWIGGRNVLVNQTMDPEDFIRFILLLFAILNPIKGMNVVNTEIQTALASAERVFSLLDSPRSIADAEDAISPDQFTDSIKFEAASFSYDDTEGKVLDDVFFHIRKGEVVAVVGESGAGKSTIADLIPRFFDVKKGSVTLDGTDIRNIRLHSLRRLMGIVPQETILFNDTIRNNISYGEKEADSGKMREAAEAANALKFIEEQPAGFETIIGDRGVKLSGGQRQRLAIARALLKNPPILILDEATSSLDTESEKKVQEAIDRLMKERTVFVIAHRLSTVLNADRIIVLRRGKIVETGTHAELLQNNGYYKKLYEVQFGEGVFQSA